MSHSPLPSGFDHHLRPSIPVGFGDQFGHLHRREFSFCPSFLPSPLLPAPASCLASFLLSLLADDERPQPTPNPSDPRRTASQTPPASQRKQPRQSLINAAARSITPCKPSPSPLPLPAAAAVVEKSQSPAGLFAGLLSPFKSAPSSPSVNAEERFGDQEQDQQDGQEEEQEQDLMSWDEQPHPHLDGEKGDLITWDEVEVELVPTAVDEEEEEVAAAPDEEEGLAIALEEKEKEATPQKARGRFTMQVTPTLSQRVRFSLSPFLLPSFFLFLPSSRAHPSLARSQPRTLRAPSTLQPARQHSGDQGQGQGRRTSMRMTIVPSSRAGEWIKERDERRRREERVLEEIRVAVRFLVAPLRGRQTVES